MFRNSLFIILLSSIFTSCGQMTSQQKESVEESQITSKKIVLNPKGKTIITRVPAPENFYRESYSKKDFGYFLQHLPLFPIAQEVRYFNGKLKPRQQIYNSVIALSIGKRDLHQCADAVMRLRADYLYQQKRYDEIRFNFLSDGKPRFYTEYANGDFSYPHYWSYLEYIFSYANTASLHDELPTVSDTREVKIGDTFIQKGNPIGHAVMVVDLVKNAAGKKLVLLAQSYMPAQEIQLLNNWNNPKISPWYSIDNDVILTPEWKFDAQNLKTWK